MLRELVTKPISTVVALVDLPRTLQRSVREAGELMEISRRQLEMMQRQADQALEQAERMNDLLARVVRLTEPLEKAQRGGEIVGGRLKRAILGDARRETEAVIEDAEVAAAHAEAAAEEAESAAEGAGSAAMEADEAAEEADEAVEDADRSAGDADQAAEEADSRS